MAAGTLAPDDDAIQGAGQVPAMPAIQGQGPPQTQTLAPQPGAAPAPAPALSAAAPQPGAGIAAGTGNTKGEIATPAVKLKFDDEKLKKAQTTLEVLNAATAQSRKQYMDWWQQQHGDIDQKYDNMKTQLGARPGDDEPSTKKEKFAALLEFGLHLMKNSSAPTSNQGGVLTGTLSDEHDAMDKAHQDSITKAQGDYDTQAAAIETARGKAQAGIGTAAAAQKDSSDQAAADSKGVKDQASALKSINDVDTTKASSLGAPTYAVGPGGVIHAIVRDADGHAHAEPVTGIDGKPFQGKVLGREAGSGIDKSKQDPAAVRTHKYLTQVLGIDDDTAVKIAFKPKTGNPNADHAAIFRSVMSATMGDEEKAKRVADQYTLDQYGARGVAAANAPIVDEKPPPAAMQGLQHGQVRNFGAKGSWTVGIDGKPIRVPAGSIAGGAPQTPQ